MMGGLGGGVATLILRMGSWLIDHDCTVYAVVTNDGDMLLQRQVEEKGIHVCKDANVRRSLHSIYRQNESFFICFEIEAFMQVEIYCKKPRYNIFYDVIPDPYKRFVNRNGVEKCAGKLFKRIYFKPLAVHMAKRKRLVYMDVTVQQSLTKYFNGRIKAKIIHLPYKPGSKNNWNIKHKKPVILSAARLEFPFKGYLIGLIDIFEDISKKHDIRLKIVGSGDGRQMLLDKVKNSNVKDKVELANAVGYDELLREMAAARVFVGMGTTVLDAAAQGTLSIPVSMETFQCQSRDFFSDYPEISVTDEFIVFESTRKLIEEAFMMSDLEYAAKIKEQRKNLTDHYEISRIMKQWMDSFRQCKPLSFIFYQSFRIYLRYYDYRIGKIWQ